MKFGTQGFVAIRRYLFLLLLVLLLNDYKCSDNILNNYGNDASICELCMLTS